MLEIHSIQPCFPFLPNSACQESSCLEMRPILYSTPIAAIPSAALAVADVPKSTEFQTPKTSVCSPCYEHFTALRLRGISKQTFAEARRAVAGAMPSAPPIVRQVAPWAHKRLISTVSATFRGLPSFLPFATALRSPARTRSTIRLRSSSAENHLSSGRGGVHLFRLAA
jgi:hypothetical protein